MDSMHPIDDRIAAVLPEGSLYAVGGRVRDEIRAELEGTQRPSIADSDYLVVGLPMPELIERLRPLGRVDAVGASFSVLKVTVEGETVDVAVPRRERSIGTGHRDFVVESGPEVTLEEDLGRRDFRMNMLARALPTGEIVDPYAGEADIRARRIDILTPASFREDPLRMLRAAQFAARFEYDATPATRAAMTEAAPLVRTVSPERIHDELVKLLGARKPSIGLVLLEETCVLA
ncbi:MAG TPA: polynucleotide adenylyltransferase, partial [Candidatus Nitrosotalea sp.]|nr:polynucleotide adenylyltransferase [Candidatus Nitrosotalea sp.]